MRCYIHSRTFDTFLRLPPEKEIYDGRHECNRYISHSSLLHNFNCYKLWSRRDKLSSNFESAESDSYSEAHEEFTQTSLFAVDSTSMCGRHCFPILYLFLSNYSFRNSNFLLGTCGRRPEVLQYSWIILVHLRHTYDRRVGIIYLYHFLFCTRSITIDV